MATMLNTKESVHLRKKKLLDGKVSLYLDIYSNGIRQYEFLKLYLIPETNKTAKQQNKDTLRIAEVMKIQRLAEIQKNPLTKQPVQGTKLVAFARKCIADKKKGTASTYNNVISLMEKHFGENYLVEDLTEDAIKDFYSFIGTVPNHARPKTKLSTTTQHSYCVIFNVFLKQAADEKIIPYDIARHVKMVRSDEKARNYLTIEELQKLSKSRLNKTYKRAFLFSCFTGIRRSDVLALTWGDVMDQDGFTRIIFRQKKTTSVEYLDISQQAKQMMGERDDNDAKVFPNLRITSYTSIALTKWVKSIGINKKITFHCARHTFAVMMLTVGVDIYTTSKLLGHKSLETTQIYAKIVDKKKQEAVTKIPIVL